MQSITLTVPLLLIVSVVVVSLVAWKSKALMSGMILNPHLVRQRFQVHRLLTAGWLHADGGHLFFNMLTLYFFADRVAATLGPARFLLLYVSAVIVAHIPTTLRQMGNPRYNSLGASGAVAAVIFSAVLLYPGMKLSLLFLPIPLPGVVYGGLYLAYSAYQSYRAKGIINHDAHFAGALYGALLTYVFEPERAAQTLKSFF